MCISRSQNFFVNMFFLVFNAVIHVWFLSAGIPNNGNINRYQDVFVYLFYEVLNCSFSSSNVRDLPLESFYLRYPHRKNLLWITALKTRFWSNKFDEDILRKVDANFRKRLQKISLLFVKIFNINRFYFKHLSIIFILIKRV